MSKAVRNLLAVDPSLTASGWALFSLTTGLPLIWGVIRSDSPRVSLAQRMAKFQAEVEQLFDEQRVDNRDAVVCEGPAPLVLNPQSALKVEGIRGIFETVARSRGAVVPGRLNPRTVQSELLGMKGSQLPRQQVKEIARQTAEQLFGENLRALGENATIGRASAVNVVKFSSKTHLSQDIVDALLIGAVAISRLRFAASSGLPLEEAFAPRSRSRGFVGGGRRGTGWTEEDVRKLRG